MARIITSGFELNSKTIGIEVDAVTTAGTFSLDTGTVRSGTYSLKCTTAAQTGNVRYMAFSVNQTTNGYFRSYFNISSTPTTNSIIAFLGTSGNVVIGSVQLTTTNTLQLLNRAGAQIGSDSAALTNGRWYRLELTSDGGNPGNIGARFVDCGASGVDPGGAGTTIASGANSSSSAWAQCGVGMRTSTTGTIYFDDIALNDSTGADQNSYPGSGRVIALRPDSAGDANGFLVQVGGTAGSTNNFTRVNEVTPDGVTTYNASAVLNAEDLFNCGASGIGSGDTVNVVSVGGQYANTVAADATAAFKFEVMKTTGGTKAQSAAIIPNSTTFAVNSSVATSASLYGIILYKDPDATNPWTQTTLDSMQIGYTETTSNVQSIAISNVIALVDYTPAAVASAGRKLSLLGAGL